MSVSNNTTYIHRSYPLITLHTIHNMTANGHQNGHAVKGAVNGEVDPSRYWGKPFVPNGAESFEVGTSISYLCLS